MAGTGSRLRGTTQALPKPLIRIASRPLISYTIASFEKIGVQNIHAVVGPNGEELAAAVAPLLPSSMRFHAVPNSNWQKQNGVSVLTVAGKVRAPFFLTMGDHLFEPEILDRLLNHSDAEMLNLAIDRKIDSIFDLDDAMKVQTQDDLVVAIGKNLSSYDAIDTGIFLCPESIFDFLRGELRDDDCSLADGVRAMALAKKVRAIDIGEAWWQDVDTPEMLAEAERLTSGRAQPDLQGQR